MMWQTTFLVLFICCVQQGCKPPQNAAQNDIRVSADFDCGSIGTLTQLPGNVLTGPTTHWKHKSSTDDQYYWFYFRMDNVRNRSVTVKLQNLEGTYRGKPHLIYTPETQPVYSYDQHTWNRLTDVSYDSAAHVFTFHCRSTHDAVWVAYAHPYSYGRQLEFIHSLSAGNPNLKMEVLGKSAQLREIQLLTITDPGVPDADKKVVMITALQHAGEYIGGYFVEGMINYLLSGDAGAVQARRKIIYKIVPMMNPDGIYHGTTRLNGNYEDLNQEWDDDFTDSIHAPTEPEVAAVKHWMRDWIHSGNTIDLALDVHSQGQQGTENILHTPAGVLNGFTEKLQKYWPVENIPMTFSGSANDCFVNEFKIPAGTFEIPQSSAGGAAYLTTADYHNYGKGTVQGINDYFFSDKKSK